jgi:hypothetical protein
MFIDNLRSCSPWLVLATLSACQHSTNAPVNAPPKPAVSVAPAPLQTMDRQQVDPAPTDPSPFVEGVRLGYAARLTVAGQRAFLSTEKLLLGVQDDGVRIEPALLEGLQQGRSQFPLVFGSMPESGWALHSSYSERTSRSSLSRWTGSEWVDANGSLQNKNLIGISSWSDGRTLALTGGDYGTPPGFVQLAGARGVAVPQLSRAAHNDLGCGHAIRPGSMAALPSGEVLLAGTRCAVSADGDVAYHGTIVESWAPGKARGKVSALPGLAEKDASWADIYSIVASSAHDVFVAGGRMPRGAAGQEAKEEAYVAHFDGKTWRALPAPPIDHIDELQRTPSGRLWALYVGELWTTNEPASESATWQRVVMPQLASEAGENAISSFWVQDDEQVWATLGSDAFSYLVRTKRGAAPLSAPADEQIAQLSNAFDPMAAYQCESPTLVLLALSRQAPKDADMPSVRGVLRGHTEFDGKVQFMELPFLTRRYLGARGDRDTLIAIQDLLSGAKIPGVSPELRCLEAAPTRTLSVDFVGLRPDPPTLGKTPHDKSAIRQ